jgi:hypothetical protein
MQRYGRRCQDGHIVDVRTGATILCDTEERFFQLAGMGCLPARLRDSAGAGAEIGAR